MVNSLVIDNELSNGILEAIATNDPLIKFNIKFADYIQPIESVGLADTFNRHLILSHFENQDHLVLGFGDNYLLFG